MDGLTHGIDDDELGVKVSSVFGVRDGWMCRNSGDFDERRKIMAAADRGINAFNWNIV